MSARTIPPYKLTKMRQLQAEGWRAAWIADACHVCERTVYRYLPPFGPAPREPEPLPGEVTGSEWPAVFGDWLVEPGAGTVRLRKRRGEPRVLEAADVRLLAAGAAPDLQAVLELAVCEAERQREALGECMG